MKKVDRHGWDKYLTVCNKCGCTFAYELSDVFGENNYLGEQLVTCPECEYQTPHNYLNVCPSDVWDVYMADGYVAKKHSCDIKEG